MSGASVRPLAEPSSRLAGLACLVLDPSGRVTHWSSGASGLFGHSPEQAAGRDIRDLLVGLDRETVEEALEKVTGGHVRSGPVRVECADGRGHLVEFRWEPLAGAANSTSIVVSAARADGPGTCDAALTLQRSLLPGGFNAPRGVEVAYRYLPASETNIVGGDWCDVIGLPGGRVALVVGDAMGHDIHAAAAMGQLRTAMRVLARLDLPPLEVLSRLDWIAEDLSEVDFATCLYVTCDPATSCCAVGRAGHPRPVVAHADGTSDVVEMPPGLPLGVSQLTDDIAQPFEATELSLPAGSTLVLCSDGLLERRALGRDSDAGTAALQAVLATTPATPRSCLEATCDHIMAALGSDQDDDITLLLARLHPPEPAD